MHIWQIKLLMAFVSFQSRCVLHRNDLISILLINRFTLRKKGKSIFCRSNELPKTIVPSKIPILITLQTILICENCVGNVIPRKDIIHSGNVVSVLFGSLDTNTRVTYSGQEESTARRWDCKEFPGEQETVLVKADRFDPWQILGVRLYCAPLTKQTQKRDQVTT